MRTFGKKGTRDVDWAAGLRKLKELCAEHGHNMQLVAGGEKIQSYDEQMGVRGVQVSSYHRCVNSNCKAVHYLAVSDGSEPALGKKGTILRLHVSEEVMIKCGTEPNLLSTLNGRISHPGNTTVH